MRTFIAMVAAFVIQTNISYATDDAQCNLTLGWETSEPYQYIDDNNRHTGFDIELIRVIVSNLHCNLRFKEVIWARGLVEIQSGDIDMLAYADYTEERSEWAHFSEPYRDDSLVLFVRKGGSKKYPFNSLSDIIDSDFELGVGRSVYAGEQFEALMEEPEFRKHVSFSPVDEVQQYEMLQANRFTGYIKTISTYDSLAKLLGEDLNLEVHPLAINSSDQHVMFSRKSVDEKLVSQFNLELENVKKSGQYRELTERFLK